MSLTSTPFSTDDERYSGYTNSATSPKQLVQEVSLSYSSPYTSTVKRSRHYDLPPSHSPYLLESEYDKNEELHSHTCSYDSRLSQGVGSAANKFYSVERLLNSGKIETEFPAKVSPTESVPYFSAQSAIKAGRITPVTTPRATPTFDQASTVRLNSALSQNTIVSESTTFEELTTITTSNSRTTRKKEIKTEEMPTVNALTKQFEATTQQERVVPLRPRNQSSTHQNQREKSKSRVIVIDKTEKYSNSTQPAVVYSPGGILTTTIVDIEPARFGRHTEEYKLQEEYIVKRYDRNSPNSRDYNNSREVRAYAEEDRERQDYYRKNYTRNGNSPDNRENIESPIDTSPIDVVRNVIDQFETKIGGTTRSYSSEQHRSISRIDMNDNKSNLQEKIIVHQKNESEPGKHVERIIPISSFPATQSGLVQNYEEIKTVIMKHTPSEPLPVTPLPIPNTQEEYVPEETIASPPPVATPSPTLDIAEEILKTDVILQVLTTKPTVVEHSRSTMTQASKGTDKHPKKVEYVISENMERHHDLVTEESSPATENQTEHEVTARTRDDDYLQNFFDRDYQIKTYEELLTTTRRRARSQQPERQSPASYSSMSDRSRTIDRCYGRNAFGSGLSRTYSEGRGLASGAYVTGGLISGNLVSGMSSAGAICTSHIRDAREREKREIGLLNDRLADYIEKVRFLEAQNQCLSHDIDILRKGFSGGGHVSALFDSEISQAKRILEQTIASRATFERDIAGLSADIDVFRKKWLDAISAVKAHREDHDVDLDRLAKLEAEISLFKRKIRIVEEDVIRIRRENDGIANEIARIRQLTFTEVALKNERSLNVQDLLQRIKLLQTENSSRIEQELVFIRRDTTAENRDYFRHELQAAIRDIRANYEEISLRNRNDIEVWYREQIRKIQSDAGRVNVDLYREELATIRSTVLNVKSRLAEVESRNFFLEKHIADLRQSEEAKFFEISLAEKDAQIARLRDQCTELSIQMEKLCDNEISLRAEIERYRVLLNGANVTTYVSNTSVPAGHYSSSTRVVSQTTRTHSSSNTSYTGVPASRSGGITIGGNIGGISVGGTIGATSATAHATTGAAGSVPRPERIHDETGTDYSGRNFHRWYLGTISVNQVTPDFIELKNICKIRKVDVGGFRVEQTRGGSVLGSTTINVPLILEPQEILRINSSPGKHIGQFFMDVEQFDISTSARTSLYNYSEPDQERGWFVFLN
ncbi:unnamed protein product [Caenorhabditis sp. 36 PRJEB53466]|nr:unnamed protein product [Caenorhabditis sp. 36 PRJEB53466]